MALSLVRNLIKPLLFILIGIALTFAAMKAIGPSGFGGFFSSAPVTETDEVVESVHREEQIVLVSLGIQGVSETAAENREFFGGITVPGSGRGFLAKYAFSAKLGVEGGDVEIHKTGEKEYTIALPEFIFIGHSDVDLQTVSEKNGVLSFVTPKFDQLKIASEILGADEMRKYINEYRDDLTDQAQVFYTGIVKGIDPDVELKFEFAD